MAANKSLFIIIGILAVTIIGFGGYKVWRHYSLSASMSPTMQPTASMHPTMAPSMSPSATNNAGLPNKTDTSNTQLDQDVQNIQNSMNQLNQDQGTSANDVSNQSQDNPQP